MAANQQLQFLQQKITEINSAILFNLSDSVLKFPTTIVSTAKVDDYGYLWFFVKRPKQNVKEFDNEFPVRLDYFRKGSDFFLQVMGKAWVVTDPEELNTFAAIYEADSKNIDENTVLLKVKMMKADYQETQSRNHGSWWANAVNFVATWFKSSSYRPSTYFTAS